MFVGVYNSVPQKALWITLQKLGVPDDMTTLIKSFHQDMRTILRVDCKMLEEIEEANGLEIGVEWLSRCLTFMLVSLLKDSWTGLRQ